MKQVLKCGQAIAAVALLVGCSSDDGANASGGGSGTGGTGATSSSGGGAGEGTNDAGSSGGSGGSAGAGGGAGASGNGGSGGSFVPSDWCEKGGSTLAQIAQTLAPRSWAKLPDNASLDALDFDYSLLYWADSAVWDPAQRKFRWVGGPGTCCADPATYQLVEYDVETDTWSMQATPFEGSGHAYDGNALHPGSSLLYFAKFHDEIVRTFDGSSWGVLPELPFEAQAAVGLTWFPELFGGALVYVNSHGQTAWFADGTWNVVPGVGDDAWGSYNMFAEYNPVHQLVWMGAGNGAEAKSWLLDAQAQLSPMPDAPFSLNVGDALHFADPISGNFVAHDEETRTWWQLDPIAKSWSQITDMQSAPDFTNSQAWERAIQAPIPECGVTLFLSHYYEHRNVYVYRH